jgi:sterol desaturase/sphingolipid hydroxylase (fatty acid hydroxylase superfamily)
MANYIALAVPFFFLFIAIELVVAWRQGRKLYRLPDAFADLGCGITQRISLLFFDAFLGIGYYWIYQHGKIVDLTKYPLAMWAVTFVGVDLVFYLWHRASHRVNFLWAAHVVHHQSEEFNFAVALRQGILTPITSVPFALPLAFLGVPPLVYGAVSAISTLYQFWIHTQLIGKLGPLERILNTPSHHRVHHARNPAYIDRNYGAIFIIWDRLFGTFAEEREAPQYGITKPLGSFNPLLAQVQSLGDLNAESRGAPSLWQRLAVWFAPPERVFPWRPTAEKAGARHEVKLRPRMVGYVLSQFALIIGLTFGLMMWGSSLSREWMIASATLVLLTLLALAGLMEARRWARPLEAVRVAGVLVMFVLLVR